MVIETHRLPKFAQKYFNGNASHIWGTETTAVAWPDENLPEVAFIGRSNVGKSSLINAILKRNKLARTSSTPGATRAVHFYEVPACFRIVDLPGYGYAKLSKTQSAALSDLIWEYLTSRRCLKRVFLLIDGRHGLKKGDREQLRAFADVGVGVTLIMTKADKMRAGSGSWKKIDAEIRALGAEFPFVSDEIYWISSEKGDNIDALRLFVLNECAIES